jgi:hypothetical protein
MGARGRLPAAARVAHSSPAIWDVPCRAKCPRAIGTGLAHHLADLIRSLSDLAVVTPHSPVAR